MALFILGSAVKVSADEGMWLPMLIKRLNYADMQKHGLQLTPEEIYSVNNASLKDAIVVLNGGSCTAEMISSNGLFLTNHHCAFGVIQDNSTTAHDYLTDGFWAKTLKDELSANGMTASYLVEMRDVTDKVLGDVSITLKGADRSKAIQEAIKAVEEEVAGEVEEHYEIKTRSFFEGNEYYLFVYETFRDVRLTGAPPSSIGKYGGDTDNWMWPRHTGDFSLMRVYMGADGKPADYSEENVPYQPKHHLPISMNGVEQGDYAMIMGYPGSTDRYLSSYGVQQELSIRQPTIVQIREKRLELMREDMKSSDEVRIKYASKHAGVSNYYKYFIGQQRGLKRLKVYEKKKALEDEFDAWVQKDEKRKETYGSVTNMWAESFATTDKTAKAMTYVNEVVFASEIVVLSYRASQLYRTLSTEDVSQEAVDAAKAALMSRAEKHFKDYNQSTDRKITTALFEMYSKDVKPEMQSPKFREMAAKSKGDFTKEVNKMFDKSVFASKESLEAFLENPSTKKLDKDPVFAFMDNTLQFFRSDLLAMIGDADENITYANRLFVNGLRKMNSDKDYYPNANSTMRVTYGNVGDYVPSDAVYYNYYTTLAGVMEKEDPNNDEFIVPARLKKLYMNKDYGQYGQDGEMRVCFITNNDITGGNSGSPVINGKGELIGCAFDGNWEAMSGDIAFEERLQRTIAVDIRYVLFIIDKFADAGHLVDEMTLVRSEPEAAAKPTIEAVKPQ